MLLAGYVWWPLQRGDPNVTNTNTVKKLVQWIKKLLTPPRGDPNVTETNTVKKLVHSIKKLLTPPGGDPNVTDTNTVKKDQNTVNPSGWRSQCNWRKYC